MRAVVVVVVLPPLRFVGEQAGVVDDLAVEEPVELFGVDPVGPFHFAVQPGGPRFDADVVDALSSRCQWNEAPNSDPLSVCTRSTANGSLAMTSSTNWMAVFGRSACKRAAPGAGCSRRWR